MNQKPRPIGHKGYPDNMETDHDFTDRKTPEQDIEHLASSFRRGRQQHVISKWRDYVSERRKIELTKASKIWEIEQTEDVQEDINGIGLDNVSDTQEFKVGFGEPVKVTKGITPYKKGNVSLFEYFENPVNEKVNLGDIEALLNKGGDINSIDPHKQTIFHEVARTWKTDVAEFLIEKGAKVNVCDAFGRTPLHIASAVDNPDMVNLLINNGADKEAKTSGDIQTPAHFAAKYGACRSLKTLIKHGCDIKNAKDYKGRTPIHVAAELGRCETVTLLLSLKAPMHNFSENDRDKMGSTCMTRMIGKMPLVAYKALDNCREIDEANRKEKIHLNRLVELDLNQSPLFAVVTQYRYQLIMHPCFRRLIDVMWLKFGRKRIWLEVFINVMSTILWTIIGVAIEYDERHLYVFPGHAWRVVLPFIAICITVWHIIFEERMELRSSMKSHRQWVEGRRQEIVNDIAFCHPRWPEERRLLERELDALQDVDQSYFGDMWNVFDWMCYVLLLISIATHLVDIGYHSEHLSRWHIRIMCVTIIMLWLRLMKTARAFSFLGPFIVMLGHIFKDCLRFLFLYLEFYIPYVCAFWMIFGGDKRAENDILGNSKNESIIVSGFQYPGQVLFSVFRLTLVDDYDFDTMYSVDSVMATLLVWSWLAFSAIICINILIALMSETFKRIYDNAKSNSIMQRAITLLSIWDKMGDEDKNKFMDYIAKSCSPLEVDFYDDLKVQGEQDLTQVTFQIKEQLNDLQEQWSLHFGEADEQLLDKSKDAASLTTQTQYEKAVTDLKAAFKIELRTINKHMEMLSDKLTILIEKDESRSKSEYSSHAEGGTNLVSVKPMKEIRIEVQPTHFTKSNFPDLPGSYA